ncbi:MAG TPA: LPS export ABC transporter periplasmic protein LptC [Chitinophagaceae bacterium]|nr:LPS export ABC transporter periplasmic protein LptC [Chitinophagaceae bacterium]
MRYFYAAACILSCCFFCSCENDPKEINELSKNKVMTEEAKDIVSYMSQHGVMRAKLKAPLMLRVIADTVYVEFPHSLHVDFFDDSAKVESWLDSRYGKYFENLNKVYLRDSVVVINTKGDTLKTPDLWWDQNTKMFYTDKVARYFTKDKQIVGEKGLEATQDLRSVTFKQTTGTLQVSENGASKE